MKANIMKYKKLSITLCNTDNEYTRTLVFDIRDIGVAQKWAQALADDYLDPDKTIRLEKQFMLHGWVYPDNSNSRTISFMCDELNFHIDAVNNYAKKHDIPYHIDMHFDPQTVDQEQLNEIHHHFEVLIGQVWAVSNYYNLFDRLHQWSINNFNWLCHEIESQLRGIDAYNHGRSNSSIVTCLYPIVRHDMSLEQGDWDYFEMRDLEFGQIRMHYAQTGKTHREAWHDQDEDIYDSNISGIRYISGEFDVDLNTPAYKPDGTPYETDWEGFKQWLMKKNVDITDKTLALGWCVFADLNRDNWADKTDFEIMQELWNCDDIKTIELTLSNGKTISKTWDYTWRDLYFDIKQNLIESVK